MASQKPGDIIAVVIRLLWIPVILVGGLLGLSLGIGALLNWIAPTISWEIASLLAAVIMVSVITHIIVVAAAFAISPFGFIKNQIEVIDDDEWEGGIDDESDYEELAKQLETVALVQRSKKRRRR